MIANACITVMLAQQGGISAKGWVKKGYYALMGIVMDCFCWAMFELLQTLFRLEPMLGPLGLGDHNYVRMINGEILLLHAIKN